MVDNYFYPYFAHFSGRGNLLGKSSFSGEKILNIKKKKQQH